MEGLISYVKPYVMSAKLLIQESTCNQYSDEFRWEMSQESR